MAIEVLAPAKINLTLHVTGWRTDGYHLLDSLVVFADVGDTVRARPAAQLGLVVDGPMAADVPSDTSNLVLKAARWLDSGKGAALNLTKRLPSSSGIGGGSSDAAAALRALSVLWRVACPVPARTLSLGADVPVCMVPKARRMSGIGERLSAPVALPGADILLVNPGVAVSTPAVFGRLEQRDNPPMPGILPEWRDIRELANWLQGQRNDLQRAACALQPAIRDVLAALERTGCLLARMTGSGATCFALFPPDGRSARAGRAQLCAGHPDWWAVSGRLLR